jgi:RNA polymerase sigma-70 factor (ECF subfamily)
MGASQMPQPHSNGDSRFNSHSANDLNRFRPYLLMLARMQFDDVLQSKLDESDIVQQTLLEAHHSIAAFRGKSSGEMAAWLRQILARNLADEIKRFRRGKRDLRMEQSLQLALNESTIRVQQWLAKDDPSPSDCAIANEQVLALAAALIKLPADQRRAIELRQLLGHSFAEVAKHLGRTEIAAASLFRRGIKTLRQLMRDDKLR